MATLAEVLLNPGARPQVIRDCIALLESEVDRKSGLSGLAIKAGFKALKAAKPGMIEGAMDSLLDEFVHRLEPVHTDYVANHRAVPLEKHLSSNAARIANILLGITDERAKRSDHGLVRSTYEKLRPLASKQIEEAMPAVAQLLKRHMKY